CRGNTPPAYLGGRIAYGLPSIDSGRQLHDLLQIDDTSLTHWASHLTLQQNESSEQMSPAQLSQVPVSLTPELQIEWAQVVPPPPPPVHDWPQTDWTSPTQIESHELLQQNEAA